MNQVAAFDDTALTPGDALDLRAAADRIRTRMRRSVEDIIEIGRDLAAAKKTVGHGNFLRWIEAEARMNERTANRFIGIYKKFGKSDRLSDLKVTHEALYLLAAPSTEPEVVEAAMEKAGAGEKIDRKGVEEIKAALKTERGKARDLRIDKQALQTQNARLNETENELRERVLLLGHELERSQRAQGGPVELEVNKYRATLRLVWDMTPPEDRTWFLAEVAQ